MKIIDINKEQFLSLLLNRKPFDQGQFGILTLTNDKLYKIYYKDFIDTYIKKDGNELDDEVDIMLEVEKDSSYGLRSPSKRLERFSRLLDTKSNDLITGILSYRGLFVGIEMNYYDGYITLGDAIEMITKEEMEHYIRISYDLAQDLMKYDIVPRDISENNILVNIATGDVKLIDLDGLETTYGPKNYVNNYPHNINAVNTRFREMIFRLNNKINKTK